MILLWKNENIRKNERERGFFVKCKACFGTEGVFFFIENFT